MLLAAGGATLDGVAGVDAGLAALAARWRAVAYEVEDLGGELRRYAEGLDAEPGALEAAEERLAVVERLKRKHGGTIADVLAHAEACRARGDELAGAEVALEHGAAELEAARGEQARAAAGRRGARREAGPPPAPAGRGRPPGPGPEGAGRRI